MGYHSVLSIDTSEMVVKDMKYKYGGCEGMEFQVGDAMKLDAFPDKR